MQNDTHNHKLKEEQFKKFLDSKHLRKTPERFEILRCALECDGHFDADSLHRMLEAGGYHVSKATVYNTIELMCEGGIMRKLLFDTHQARYELAEETHCHIICTRCGEIREIEMEEINKTLSCLDFPDFRPAYISTCIYGVCRKCSHKPENTSEELYKSSRKNINKNNNN